MFRLFIIIFLTCLFFACNKPFITENDFGKLGFSSTGCFGDCPIMQGEIDNKKSFRFHGIKLTNATGYYTGVIPDSIYEQFITKLVLIKNEIKKSNVIYLDVPADVQDMQFKFIRIDGT